MSLSSYLGSFCTTQYCQDTKMENVLVEVHKIMRNTSTLNILIDEIYNVPTQEVGGCFDALHRYNSLRCLVTPIFLLIDQFLYRFSTYGPKTNEF